MAIVVFNFGHGSGNIMKRYLIKEYRCGNCKSADINILINNGGVKTYQCNECERYACNPRIYYKLKEEYKSVESVKKIMDGLGISTDCGFYHGKVAVLVTALKDFLEGGEGISRNTTHLYLEKKT